LIKLLTILGARPQFIKASNFSRYIATDQRFTEEILHTGQHYDENMSGVFFSELDLPLPDYQLSVGSGSHGEQTAAMLTGIETVLMENRFDMVVVYGDTNSTLAGSLAASKLSIPLVHIESGLRSFNRTMPEEINRIVSDQLSDINCCPTMSAIDNLTTSGIHGEFVVNSGDIMLESLLHYRTRALENKNFQNNEDLLGNPYVLLTFHRAENTDKLARLSNIVENLVVLSQSYRIIFPIHPRTKKALKKAGLLNQITASCTVIDPVGFLEMINLISFSTAVITDSGGLQKEAFFLNKHSVVMRAETEWVELIEMKAIVLWDTLGKSPLIKAINNCLTVKIAEAKPYGTGNSSELIASTIHKYFNT